MTDSLMGQLPALEMTIAGSVHLLTDRWLDHCERTWSVSPDKVRFTARGSNALSVEASYYLDRQGRIWKPPFSPGPYLPLVVRHPEDLTRQQLNEQWLEAGRALARDMRERGLAQRVALPPSITDARPWQWEGFRVEVLYTYMLDLPMDEAHMRPHIRRSVRKAANAGYVCARVMNMEHVYECLSETQERQGFDLKISMDDLTYAQHALGHDLLRAYVAYAPNGEAASSTVEIHEPGGTAVGWLAGTKCDHLTSGVSQLLNAYIMEDLHDHGAIAYDFAGANIPSVASSKLQWGARLRPFFAVEGGTVADIARHMRRYWRFQRAR